MKSTALSFFFKVFASTIGKIGVVWVVRQNKNPLLKRIYLPPVSGDVYNKILHNFPNAQEKKIAPFPNLIDEIRSLSKGNDIFVSSKILDFSEYTSFERCVLTHTRAIPYGQVRTYSELASDAHTPRASRAVGNVMRKNPFPLVIPCHRVVNTGGFIGEFQAGKTLKWRLLEREGLRIDCQGRINR